MSEDYVDSLHDAGVAPDITLAGYVYARSADTVGFYTECQLGSDGPEYYTTIGNDSRRHDNKRDAALHLWYRFALCELNPQLRPVRFSFADGETFEGYSAGDTWNGWDNVLVTPDVHERVVEYFTEGYGCCDECGAPCDAGTVCRRCARGVGVNETAEEFAEMEPDEFGLYDYGNCYCTTIEEPDECAPHVDPSRQFGACWFDHYAPEAKQVSGDFFTPGRGYGVDDLATIASLAIGETHTLDAGHVVVRVG